ncbi:hypothetical protein KGV55_03305, partial [Candidatus Gracilibacteria bacterium]|nr:hypothetical protein [Candidatus Gracilibacteria bacterium]
MSIDNINEYYKAARDEELNKNFLDALNKLKKQGKNVTEADFQDLKAEYDKVKNEEKEHFLAISKEELEYLGTLLGMKNEQDKQSMNKVLNALIRKTKNTIQKKAEVVKKEAKKVQDNATKATVTDEKKEVAQKVQDGQAEIKNADESSYSVTIENNKIIALMRGKLKNPINIADFQKLSDDDIKNLATTEENSEESIGGGNDDKGKTGEQAGDEAKTGEQAGDEAKTGEQAGDEAKNGEQAGDEAKTGEQAGDEAKT